MAENRLETDNRAKDIQDKFRKWSEARNDWDTQAR